MQETIRLLLGIVVLIAGVPVGNFLSKMTTDEQTPGQQWFKLIAILGLVGGLIGLIIGNDVILFTFFFIAIVTSRSIIK